MYEATFQEPEKAVLFCATDDAGIDTSIEELIADNGFEFVRGGGIDKMYLSL